MSETVALFVEGSSAPPPARGERPLHRLWNELADALGIDRFCPIIPISKKHLVAMDPAQPPMSGAGEPLDALVMRTMKRHRFSAAVVAWDLVPAWAGPGTYCRRDEILRFYRLLSRSSRLPESWRVHAKKREQDISKRRRRPARLTRGALALCMEPMFEGLLVQDEAAVRAVLGVKKTIPSAWPRGTWGDPSEMRPDRALLKPAIVSLYRERPRPQVCRRVRGDFETNKDGWGEYILRGLLASPQAREAVVSHPICTRLEQWLGTASRRRSR